MDIETKIDKIEMCDSADISTSQVVVECDIDMEMRGGITEILSVTGDVSPIKVDAFVGEAKAYGKVDYHIVYLNAEGKLSHVDYCSDFVESVGSSLVDTTSALTVHMTLKDIDYMMKGSSIRLQSVVDMTLSMVRNNTINAVVSVENAYTKCGSVKTSRHICHIKELCDIEDEYMAGCNVEDILSFCTTACVSHVRAVEDAIAVSGEASASIVYLSDGKITTKNIVIPYDEECKCFGADKSCVADVSAHVHDSKIVIGGVEDDNSIKVCITLGFDGDVYEYGETGVVEDVCSPCCNLSLTRDSMTYRRMVGYMLSSERVNSETSIDSTIKKIVGTFAMPCSMVNVKLDDGNIAVDTLIHTRSVYIDENDEYHSVEMEMPALFNISADEVLSTDEAIVNVVVGAITSRVKRDHDIEIQVELCIEARCYRQCTEHYISAVENTGDVISPHKVMSIYFVKTGDSIWDIVKNVGASEETILKENKDIDFDHLEGGERIVVYRNIS